MIAFAALGLLAGYVAWVWVKPRVIGRSDWVVTLPGGALTLLQIVIGIVDLPDNASAAALSLSINASGLVNLKTSVLMTAAEMDAAARKTVSYRAPGR